MHCDFTCVVLVCSSNPALFHPLFGDVDFYQYVVDNTKSLGLNATGKPALWTQDWEVQSRQLMLSDLHAGSSLACRFFLPSMDAQLQWNLFARDPK